MTPHPPPLPRWLAAAALSIFAGCASPIDRVEVEALMSVQREAWNAGDLAAFVGYYHPTLTFCGSAGITRGTADLLAMYEKSYPTAKERGELSFRELEIRPLGTEHALVLGRYEILREHPAAGYFSLIVLRTADGLRIIHDHTSSQR